MPYDNPFNIGINHEHLHVYIYIYIYIILIDRHIYRCIYEMNELA